MVIPGALALGGFKHVSFPDLGMYWDDGALIHPTHDRSLWLSYQPVNNQPASQSRPSAPSSFVMNIYEPLSFHNHYQPLVVTITR